MVVMGDNLTVFDTMGSEEWEAKADRNVRFKDGHYSVRVYVFINDCNFTATWNDKLKRWEV